MSPILGARGGLAASAYGFTSAVAGPGDYESIATTTLSSNQATVTLSSIPTTYKHLQIRLTTITNRPTYGINAIGMDSFSGDTASNYSGHLLEGDGSTAYASGSANSTGFNIGQTGTGVVGNFGVTIIDILDYANTNKYKTVRALSGTDCNGLVSGYGGCVGLYSGNWRSTSAVTSLRFYLANSANFTQYSSFALYGVK
jgi:hypothetical protein